MFFFVNLITRILSSYLNIKLDFHYKDLQQLSDMSRGELFSMIYQCTASYKLNHSRVFSIVQEYFVKDYSGKFYSFKSV